VARVTVLGAGAMGTALAMHAARLGLPTALWANPLDERSLAAIRSEGRHPALTESLPADLLVFGPDEQAEALAECEVAVMGASSAGARSLARMAHSALGEVRALVSVAKGLESESLLRVSEVYADEISGVPVVCVAGPCLAAELAQGHPSAAVWASADVEDARSVGKDFASPTYQIAFSDDVVGVEYCTVMKNVAAIGVGLLDGLGGITNREFKNAKAALLTRAVDELADAVTRLGGRRESALGLAGLGDVLVTSLGGRNRLFGELVGAGEDPAATLDKLSRKGLTVEGVDSARDVHHIAERAGIDLPYHAAVYRVLFEDAEPATILEVLC
jgi:glycerol-3-phosphate dehydrogenase (NAD(P)+)